MRIPRRVGEGELFGDDSPSLIGSIVRRVGFSVLPSPAVAVLLASAATIVDGDDLKLPTSQAMQTRMSNTLAVASTFTHLVLLHLSITHAYSPHAPSQ